ncbi:ComEC/Rec2 family competence protein [Candidatus Daviesbacteria bacterium]|nr:ComEC/Rec2 family competence protein [Candidatus Daviesbacteria bacterium]
MNRNLVLILIALLLVLLLRIQAEAPLQRQSNLETEKEIYYFTKLREILSGMPKYLLPEPQASLLSGMVLGVKEDLPKEFKQNLRDTSTIHIVVVSGQNLTLLGGFILAGAALIGRKKAIVLSILVCLFYTFLTGFAVPVIRAFIMLSFSSVAQILGREKIDWWILGITALIMLIYNPNWLLSISFQLSFLATIGVVIVAPQLIRLLKSMPDILREDLAVSIAAQAMTWPIIAVNFHQVSLIGILVNSLILWTVPGIMITGAVSIITSFFIFPLGQLMALIPGVLLTYFVYIVNFFSKVSFSSIYIGKISYLVWMGYYFLLLGIFLMIYNKNKRRQLKDVAQS